MEIGKIIKKLRSEKGYTQKDLAEKLNVTPQAISRWELDAVEPSLDTIKEMAELFDVKIDEIIGTVKEEFDQDENTNYEEVLPIIGVCDKCGKPVKAGQGEQRQHGSRIYHVCKECVEQEKAEKQKQDVYKRRATKITAHTVSSIVGGLVFVLLFALAFFIDNIGLGIGVAFGVAVPLYTFLFCVLIKNNFIEEFWSTICSWGFVKFPGIIFSLDFDGIVFLIAVKILFFVLGMSLVLAAATLATVVSCILSLFTYPFALIWSIKKPETIDVD